MGLLYSRIVNGMKLTDVKMFTHCTAIRNTRKRRSVSSTGAEVRRKISKLNTTEYIHKRLFVDGVKSDITICALGRTWNLHRLYLEQCKYFDCLFRGNWKDSNDAVLHIDIIDPNITAEGFNMVLESLYNNEIEFDLNLVPSLIASASMLGLDSVVERCGELCSESLSDMSVLQSYELAQQYGLPDLFEECFEYLKRNFWRLSRNSTLLYSVSHEIMAKLMAAPDLFVLEGELNLYETVKRWIFLRTLPALQSENITEIKMGMFYSSLTNDEKNALCCTFADIICHIRIGHIVSSLRNITILRSDSIVPEKIINQVLADQWILFLRNEEENQLLEVSEEEFYENAYRLGRVLDATPKCWRWSGFNFGMDLLLNYNHGMITLRRNCLSQSTPYSTNLKIERILHYRIVIGTVHGKLKFDSLKQSCPLRIDQSIVIARIQPVAEEFPLSVHFFYMATVPGKPIEDYWKLFLENFGNSGND